MVTTKLAEAVRRLPPIPWRIDPDSHAAILNQALRGVLEELAPVVPRPRKDWITMRTWEIMSRIRA
eukprot:6393056-Alexandrium_andersonii.AAC.1